MGCNLAINEVSPVTVRGFIVSVLESLTNPTNPFRNYILYEQLVQFFTAADLLRGLTASPGSIAADALGPGFTLSYGAGLGIIVPAGGNLVFDDALVASILANPAGAISINDLSAIDLALTSLPGVPAGSPDAEVLAALNSYLAALNAYALIAEGLAASLSNTVKNAQDLAAARELVAQFYAYDTADSGLLPDVVAAKALKTYEDLIFLKFPGTFDLGECDLLFSLVEGIFLVQGEVVLLCPLPKCWKDVSGFRRFCLQNCTAARLPRGPFRAYNGPAVVLNANELTGADYVALRGIRVKFPSFGRRCRKCKYAEDECEE